MQLSSKDIKEFYSDLKQGAFYSETKNDIKISFENHTQWNALSQQSSMEKFERAILHAISVEYYDSIDLIKACMPARIYIVLAIASFIMAEGRSATIIPDEIRRDLFDILVHSRICEYKKYFSHEDYTAMIQEEKEISKWFNEQ